MSGRALFATPAEQAALDATNAVHLFDEVRRLLRGTADDVSPTPDMIRRFHGILRRGVYSFVGEFRDWRVRIAGSAHVPPHGGDKIAGLVDSMCSDLRDGPDRDPIEAAAFVLWRLAWIHPFGGGNGRTARAVSYLVLCSRLGFEPAGAPVLPERIMRERARYLAALADADAAFRDASVIDVTALVELLNDLLIEQLGPG